MAETVGFRIKIEGADDLTKTELALEKINQEIRQAKKEQNTPVYGRLRREQLVLQEDAKKLRKDIRNQIKDWQDVKKEIPTDSVIGLRKQYRDLTKQINEMSAAQRRSDFGKNIIKEAKQVKSELDKVGQSIGDFRGNVGNYRSALSQGANALIGGRSGDIASSLIAGAGAATGAAAATLATSGAIAIGEALGNMFRDASNVVLEYQQANANLNAILGTTRDETESLRVQQQELGATTAYTATEVAELQTELSKLGFGMSEILDAAPGIINLAVATGTEVPRAATLAGAALRQFNMNAAEMDRVVSVLAISTTKSALTFEKLETQLPIVGGVAAQFGKSIEDVVAQLGVLTDRGIDASTAATALRNIYLDSSKAGLTFEQAMKKIAESTNPVNTSFELFNKRGALQGAILAENSIEVQQLTGELTGLKDELQGMADKQLNTVYGRVTLLRSAWEGLVHSVIHEEGDFVGAASKVIDSLTQILNRITEINRYGFSGFFTLTGKDAENMAEYVKEVNNGWEGGAINMRKAKESLAKTKDQIDSLSLNTISGLTEKIGEVREELESAAIGSDKFNRAQKLYLELTNQLALAQGRLNKALKEDPPKGSLAEMEQRLSEINKQLARATEDSEIKRLINESVELAEKINDARIQLEGLKDAAGGGVLATKLEGDIDVETSNFLTNGDKSASEKGVDSFEKDRLNKELEDLKFLAELESNIEQELHDEQMAMLQEYENAALEVDKEIFNNQIALNEAMREEKIKTGLEIAQTIASSVFQIEYNNAQRQLNEESNRLDEQYEKRIEAAEGNADLQKKLQEELADKQEQLQREAFEDNKKRQIAEAIINGALAATQALANTTIPFPLSLANPFIIAAQTAGQIAVISSQSYDEGGFTGYGGIMDPKLPNRRISGYVHDNEYVAPTSQIQKYPQLFKFLETDRLRGFDQGGFTTPPLDYNAMLDGLAASSSLGSGVSAVDLADIISRAVYEGSRRGSQEGTLVGAKEGTKVGSFEGTKDGTKEATKESELEKIRVQRSNKNIKQ